MNKRWNHAKILIEVMPHLYSVNLGFNKQFHQVPGPKTTPLLTIWSLIVAGNKTRCTKFIRRRFG